MWVGSASVVDMDPIVGTEAIANGSLTRGQLRWRYTALYPDVYVPTDARISLSTRATGAWLWTGRTGIIAGTTAAGLWGVEPPDASAPIELIAKQRRTPRGVELRQQRISDDEVRRMGELPVTSPARTALDLGRFLPREDALIRLDRLAATTGVARQQVARLVDRYRGTRGIERAREVAGLMDAGAWSPRESLLRLRLIDAGLPHPETSVSVGDQYARAVVALGWPGPKVGIDFVDLCPDRTARRQQVWHRNVIKTNGWITIEVDDDYELPQTLYLVRKALRLRR
ncbi:type IV toxin-antitoxin system AbiEi family antitoxin [soil metagenome]